MSSSSSLYFLEAPEFVLADSPLMQYSVNILVYKNIIKKNCFFLNFNVDHVPKLREGTPTLPVFEKAAQIDMTHFKLNQELQYS